MNEAQERKAFEAWAKKHYTMWSFERWPSGEYKWSLLETAWDVWHARAALAPTVPTEPTQKPEWDQHAHATCDLNALVSMLGGENGPSIRLRAYIAERKPAVPTADLGMFDSVIAPRPLSHPLSAYHRAMSEGPLHYKWTDKPHRLVYELISALMYYGPKHTVPTEPVAWIQPDHLQKARLAPHFCRVEPTKRMADFVALYTSPQRKRLTEEEIRLMGAELQWFVSDDECFKDLVEFARAIEKAQGITGESA